GGQGSYEEAFGSLAGFIEELNGSGSVIAAARSVYYEQEFLTRANTSSEMGSVSWRLTPVEVSSWDERTLSIYLARFVENKGLSAGEAEVFSAQVHEVLSEVDVSGQALLSKPLFVARACELILDGRLESGSSLLDRLVSGYVQREVSEKLIGHDGALLTENQFEQLLEELAIEMWRQRARELNRTSLREIVSLFAQVYDLGINAQENLVDGAPNRALLTTGSKPNTIRFEHDLFFGYFLSKHVVHAALNGRRSLGLMLRRANLPVEAARS
ncbi:hypothetical protein, partial [Saccharothrix longispora]|uniref:hypothetical protein n=1 Tax=Saccharothrix longispora TaxID=33920 RepID=UPI0028FD5ECA